MSDEIKTGATKAAGQHLVQELAVLRQRVAELEASEARRKQIEQTLRALLNAPTESAVLVDSEGVILAINEVAAQRLGKRVDELVSLGIYDHLPPDLAESRKAQCDQVVRSGKPTRFQDERAGRYFDNNLYPSFDAEGKVTAVAVYARDVSESKRIENALRESEERFRALVENSTMGVSVSQENRIIFANPALLRIFGYNDLEEFIRIPLLDHVAPSLREMISERMENAARGKQVPAEFEYDIVRQDGQIRTLHAARSNIVLGSERYTQTTFQDITERKQMEVDLQESEERFRTLVEGSVEGILVHRDTKALFANPAYARILGYESPDEILAVDSVVSMIAPYEQKRMLGYHAARVKGESAPTRYEYDAVCKDGSIVPLQLLVTTIPWDGEPAVLATIIDISERKRTEKALQDSRKQLRLFIDSSPDMYFLKDKAAKYLLLNVANTQFFGKEEADIIGKTDFDLMPEKAARVCQESDSRAIEEKRMVISVENVGERVYETRKIPVITGDNVVGVAGIIRNITERKQAEEALKESNRCLEMTLAELKATQEKIIQQERLAAVGQLAAGIAHEFNNILASVVLYTQLSLHTPELSPKVRERLEIIARQAGHAADLVQQILDFGRQAILRQETLDIALLLEETLSLLRRTLPENIEIHLGRGPGEHTIRADSERIQQAIVNLALNARDAMPEGGVLRIGLERLRIAQHQDIPLPEMKVGEWVQVTVTDTGTGIPPEVLPHIYEPFFTTRAPLGHGLGLAQVYGIVKQHQGHIGVETQLETDYESGGTRFTVYWPALAVTESQVETPAGKTTDLSQGNGETILLVEDNATMRAALLDCLEMLNYQVLEAANGQEALAVFEEHQDEILLVLSDWMMPGIGGLELVRALKQRRQDSKVLILTGHSLDQEIETTAPEGIVGWVQKPPQLEQLAEAVTRALDTD